MDVDAGSNGEKVTMKVTESRNLNQRLPKHEIMRPGAEMQASLVPPSSSKLPVSRVVDCGRDRCQSEVAKNEGMNSAIARIYNDEPYEVGTIIF